MFYKENVLYPLISTGETGSVVCSEKPQSFTQHELRSFVPSKMRPIVCFVSKTMIAAEMTDGLTLMAHKLL